MSNSNKDNQISKKSFITLSRKECLEIFPQIYLSAEAKWKSALLLSRSEDFSSSNFLMVTALEEYLKALILSLDGNNFKFREIKGIKGMFENHSLRYPVLYLFHFMVSSLELPTLMRKEKGAIRKGVLLFRKFFAANSNLSWYANLHKLREDLLYSNIKDEGVILPHFITQQDFKRNYENCKKVRYAFRSILLPLNPDYHKFEPERIKFIEVLKTMTTEFGLYDSLNEQIIEIRKKGYNSNHLQTMIDLFNESRSQTSI